MTLSSHFVHESSNDAVKHFFSPLSGSSSNANYFKLRKKEECPKKNLEDISSPTQTSSVFEAALIAMMSRFVVVGCRFSQR
jgi:hypothetical protein